MPEGTLVYDPAAASAISYSKTLKSKKRWYNTFDPTNMTDLIQLKTTQNYLSTENYIIVHPGIFITVTITDDYEIYLTICTYFIPLRGNKL